MTLDDRGNLSVNREASLRVTRGIERTVARLLDTVGNSRRYSII